MRDYRLLYSGHLPSVNFIGISSLAKGELKDTLLKALSSGNLPHLHISSLPTTISWTYFQILASDTVSFTCLLGLYLVE